MLLFFFFDHFTNSDELRPFYHSSALLHISVVHALCPPNSVFLYLAVALFVYEILLICYSPNFVRISSVTLVSFYFLFSLRHYQKVKFVLLLLEVGLLRICLCYEWFRQYIADLNYLILLRLEEGILSKEFYRTLIY